MNVSRRYPLKIWRLWAVLLLPWLGKEGWREEGEELRVTRLMGHSGVSALGQAVVANLIDEITHTV
jgi:hypothetical protein